MIEEKTRRHRPNDAEPADLAETGVGTADERLAALKPELADVKDRLLRALAETENTRRRAQREREDTQKYAVTGFARDLLSPVDNLHRHWRACPRARSATRRSRASSKGSQRLNARLLAALERHGIKRIDPKGERFDHNFHQAIFETENTGQPAGTVVEVLQPGYVLHDRLLRPAMVGVAKGGAPAAAMSEGSDDAA
jgi:molecular chaperone GrpE